MFIQSISVAQDIDYARLVINELCSEKYHGRAYVKNGDKKAAKFIKKELKNNNIKPFNESYFQFFQFPVNTFPSKNYFSIGLKKYTPGKDYLITPNSSGLKGTHKIIYVSKETLKKSIIDDSIQNKIILFNLRGIEKSIQDSLIISFGAKAIIELKEDKLVYRKSMTVSKYCHIQINKEIVDTNAQTASFNIKNKYHNNYKSQNVIGFVPGESDSLIVFTAHYDHLGMMGKNVFFPGANDNGSGISMVLNLAKYYGSLLKKPKYNMAFIFFSAEEVGLIGSQYFTENPVFPLEKIKFLFNLDLVGTGDDGIMLVNGKVFTDVYDQLVEINTNNNYLSQIKARPKAANSDHYYFSEKGVKSFFIYTMGGIAEYHNIYDKAETLPLTEYEDLFRLLTDFVKSYE